ncbi:MAG: transglutaminase-like domain-containing protein [Verrucomicrobiota bacterium]
MKRWIIFLFVSLWCENVFAQVDDFKIEEDTWMMIKLHGKRIGFLHEVVSRRATPNGDEWKTEHYQKFKFQRLDSQVDMETVSSVIEDAQGVVLNFETKTEGAGTHLSTRGKREGDFIAIEGENKKYAVPATAIGPAAFDRTLRQTPLESGKYYDTQAFFADFPQAPAQIHAEVKGLETVVIEGEPRQLWKVEATSSLFPEIVSTTWFDQNFKPQYTLLPFLSLGTLEQIVTTRERAMQPLEGAEIFSRTLIQPDKPLGNVKKFQKAVYRLKLDSPGKFPLWSENEQRIVSSKKGEAEISVTLPEYEEPSITRRLPYTGSKPMNEYLQATPCLEVNDPAIIELAKQAVGDEKHPLRAAKKIEHFVRNYIKIKDLSTGFATAAETAKTATGDCTENALLAAALGRAVGLPTRIVVGLAYLDEVDKEDATGGKFGFHLWAEAWMDENIWYPMDSALSGFDVGHIAIAKIPATGSNPLLELSIPIMRMIESLKVEVVSAEIQ